MPYRYDHFTTKVMLDELRAIPRALAPGEALPRFALPTVDGGTFDTADVVGRRPLLIAAASFT